MNFIPSLPDLVHNKFLSAKESDDLTFYETQVAILHCNGLLFQIRFSPALANKPKSSKPKNSNEKPFDAFEAPPKGLLIASLPNYNLVLNKFPIIPDHFILATKSFKEQTGLLEEEDLGAAYACLRAYKDNGKDLYGFFNSGEFSGASQAHRHIQFLPVESMRSGMKEGDKWDVLVDTMTSEPDLPFEYFRSVIPENPTPQELHETYLTLHNQSLRIAETSLMSYNLGLTDRAMVICPRTAEGTTLQSPSGEFVGTVSLNGTLLAGTLLVKTEAEWNTMRAGGSKLKEVLGSIGIKPNKHDARLYSTAI